MCYVLSFIKIVTNNEPALDLSLQSGADTNGMVTNTVMQGGNPDTAATTVTETRRTVTRTNSIGPMPGTTSQDFSFFVTDNAAPDGN